MVPDNIFATVMKWLTTRTTTPPPAQLIQLLEIGGILRPGDPRPSNTEHFEISIPETLATGIAPANDNRSHGLSSVFILVMSTWLALRTKGFDHMLRVLGRQAIHGKSATDGTALARIAQYERVRHYVPLARNCLLDSLAQYRWLARDGIGCRLVFGVTGEPFAAHCWLQSDNAILNDTYEHISRFTPIMVL